MLRRTPPKRSTSPAVAPRRRGTMYWSPATSPASSRVRPQSDGERIGQRRLALHLQQDAIAHNEIAPGEARPNRGGLPSVRERGASLERLTGGAESQWIHGPVPALSRRRTRDGQERDE